MASRTIRILGRLFSFTGGVVLTLTVVGVILFYVLYMITLSHFMGRKSLDVSRRLMSPDHTKTVFLLRDYGFDLNFGVAVVYGGDRIANSQPYSTYVKRAKTLFWSGDFEPRLDVNWDENIEWSADSSFLRLIIRHTEGEQPLIWGYDFNSDRKITDTNEVETLWLERNTVPKGDNATVRKGKTGVRSQ